MNPVKVGELALKAGVKKILLTHMYPQALESDPVDSCREIFSGPVEIARQGAVYEI
jgi:ribonuclease BN (tRNA processing enzyme)